MSNILWETYRTEEDGGAKIDGPFLSYVGKNYNKNFADWLVGLNKLDSNGKPYDGRFGYITPKDILNESKKNLKRKFSTKMSVDKYAIESLKNLLEKLRDQENTLYSDLNCKDFEGFKKIWAGQKDRKNNRKKIQDYWLNKYLDLLVGETQRLITSNRTLIERILALAAIEFESFYFEGEIEHHKRDIKKVLQDSKFLTIANVTYKETNKNIDVWVPTREKYSTDDDYTVGITEFFSNLATQQVEQGLVDELENSLYYWLSRALGNVTSKNVRKKSPRNAGVNTMNRWKVTTNFSKVDPEDLANDIYKKVWDYMKVAIVYKLNEKEYAQWLSDKEEYNIQNYVREKIKKLCQLYCADNPTLKFTGQGLVTNAVQGFFGELYTYGKDLFNLKAYGNQNSVDIDIASIGGLKTKRQDRDAVAQQSGVDNIITVNGKHYGIQVKNPFTTDLGFYQTYKNKYVLNDCEYLYNNIFNFTEEEEEYFELLNLNLNNTVKPEKLRKYIKNFLYMYSGAFVRLETEKILDTEFKPYMLENLKHLKGKNINNVFFVLKGELLPSSVILEGMIEQYNYFIESVEKAEKIVSSASNPLQIRYVNTVRKNIAPAEAEMQYDPQYVDQGNEIQKDLELIKIYTALQLELPSIDSIRKRLKR